jgi:hypothetical protein
MKNKIALIIALLLTTSACTVSQTKLSDKPRNSSEKGQNSNSDDNSSIDDGVNVQTSDTQNSIIIPVSNPDTPAGPSSTSGTSTKASIASAQTLVSNFSKKIFVSRAELLKEAYSINQTLLALSGLITEDRAIFNNALYIIVRTRLRNLSPITPIFTTSEFESDDGETATEYRQVW